MLQKAGLIFTNEREFNLLKQFELSSFLVPIILKKSSQGAVYIEGDQTIIAKAPKVSVVDATGAGDVLAGVFLALRAKGVTISEALQKAVDMASLSVTNFGINHIARTYRSPRSGLF